MNYLELTESFTSKVVNKAKESTQEDKRLSIMQIQFEDPEVERICHEHGVYTVTDARKVNSIEKWFSKKFYDGGSNIKTFNEFKYFTGLTCIEDYTFRCCYSLQSITIPNSVTYIGESAFKSCESLKLINIPNSVTSIEYDAFAFCHSLQSVNIPNSVTSIGECAFHYCSSLQSVIIPDSVISIGNDAFGSCLTLKSINIPNSVTSIENCAFERCKSLKSINIPDSVTKIGKCAFRWCESLQSINIPNRVTSIGAESFRWCESLQSVNIPYSLLELGGHLKDIFYDCPLKTIYINKNNKFIKRFKVFAKKNNIQILDPSLKESFTSNVIDKTKSKTQEEKRADVVQIQFEDPVVERKCHAHGVYTIADAREVTSINGWFIIGRGYDIKTFDEFKYFIGLSSIESFTFDSCKSLQSINIPNSVTSIGNDAFYGCKSLQSINIPDSVTIIGEGAFYNCISLQSVNIPDSVTNIGDKAFYNCTSLKSIVITKNCPIYDKIKDEYHDIELVDPSLKESFTTNVIDKAKSMTQEEKRADISQIQFEDPKVERICYEHGVYTIADARKVTSIEKWFSDGDWSHAQSTIKKFDELKYFTGLTSIREDTFIFCKYLQSITIPNSVTSIGKCAFNGCRSLLSINIPNSVTSIRFEAFYNCESLQTINIPNSVISIGDWSFYGCESLTSVNIPDSVTSIGNYAFQYCESLQSVNIPDGVTNIGEYTFNFCKSLQSVNIPDDVTNIGKSAFKSCKSLQSINIPNSITSIGNDAFYGCKSLQSINIPDSVTIIGEGAFAYCKSLQSINIPNSVTIIGYGVFDGCKSLQSIIILKNCPVYKKIANEYPHIQLVDPSLKESFTSNVIDKAKSMTQEEKRANIAVIQLSKAKEKGFKFDFDKALTESFTSNVIKKSKEISQEDKRKKLFGDYIDLGLPSGTLWCKHNYGVENETDYGELYNHDEASKLDMTPGQLPSKEDFEELYRCCITKFTEINGVYGELFTSIINKESIFFPASGVIDSMSNFHSRGKDGNYWSSTYCRKEQPHSMIFSETTLYPSTCYDKNLGFSVRPVLKKNKIEESFTSNVIDKAKKITQKDKRNIVSEYVDLDLPSGILWSKCNIGASKESDFGDYLYFNDIKDKDKIPLRSDYQELVRNCNCEHEEINGVHGFKISSRKDPSKYIFFPYAGIEDPTRSTNFVYEENQKGFYFIGDIDKKTPKEYRDIFYLLKRTGFIGYPYEFRYVNPDIRKCSLRTIRRKDINESFTSKVVKSYKDKNKKKEEIKNNICQLSDYIVQNLEKECINNNLHIEDFAVYDNSSSYDDMSNDFNITFNLIYEDVDNNNVTIEVEISIVGKSITMYAMDTNYECKYIDDDGTNIEGNSHKEYVEGIIDRLKGYLDTIRNRIDDNEKWKEYEKDQDDEAAWNDPNYVRDEDE